MSNLKSLMKTETYILGLPIRLQSVCNSLSVLIYDDLLIFVKIQFWLTYNNVDKSI